MLRAGTLYYDRARSNIIHNRKIDISTFLLNHTYMALTRAQKESLTADLNVAVKDSKSMVFVHFTGITGNENVALRETMFNAGVTLKVVKKTLLKRVLGESKITGEQPALDGEIAVAYANDLMAPAREVFEFQKTSKGRFVIVGGVFDGKFMDQASMTEIATIPSLHQLRGMFVNVINSPIQGFVVALNAIAESK